MTLDFEREMKMQKHNAMLTPLVGGGSLKTTMRGLIFTLLTIIGGMTALAGNALSADESLPPEVKALIGLKILPKIEGQRGGIIPNFSREMGGMLKRHIGNGISKAELVFEEGVVNGTWPVFFINASYDDKSVEILDAQLLPKKLINWQYVKGEFKGVRNRFAFSYCHSLIEDERIILGLVKPENSHEGLSSDVAVAWEINPQSGHIETVSTQGIKCEILGE